MSDYVICINNDSNPAEPHRGSRVYRTLSDPDAEAHHMLRVIDEGQSEPDGYLYPVDQCSPQSELPEVPQRALLAAGG